MGIHVLSEYRKICGRKLYFRNARNSSIGFNHSLRLGLERKL